MQRIKRILLSPPSLRLNTAAICEVLLVLSVSLAVLFYYSRQILKQESKQDAEQTLEGTTLQVDNVLLSVEQAVGNIYWELVGHLDQPDRMYTFARKMVECNANIMGCAIAFKPNYYPDRELFMAYVYRKRYDSPELVMSETTGNKPYVEQNWYLTPMQTGTINWMVPQKGESDNADPLITFCLPILDKNRERVGVFAVDLSIDLLSQIVLSAKSSANSYCVLLNNDGAFIIHPEREKLHNQTIFTQIENGADPSVREIAEAMLAGETGNRRFTMDGEQYYGFYKPFMRTEVAGRSRADLNWSIGIVYPIKDIAAPYRHLIFQVLGIAGGGLLLFFLLCRGAFRRQMRSLRKLTYVAESIADGNFEEEIPKTRRMDEIGQFQEHFRIMQQKLAEQVAEEEKLTAQHQEHQKMLRQTYDQIQGAQFMKRNFLHHVTNQMQSPTESISKSVNILCDNYLEINMEEAKREVDNIKRQRDYILRLLDQMLHPSDNEMRKEEDHE